MLKFFSIMTSHLLYQYTTAHCLPPLLSQKPKTSYCWSKNWPQKYRECNSPAALGINVQPAQRSSRLRLGHHDVAALQAELPFGLA